MKTGQLETHADHLIFEGERFDYMDVPMNVSIIIAFGGVPVELAKAYAIVAAGNTAYLAALRDARAKLEAEHGKLNQLKDHLRTLETRMADQAEELQRLRPA